MNIRENISFKTISYRKNHDLFLKNENIVTELEGTISFLRIKEKTKPLIIGEYGFSVWNIKTARILEIDIHELLKQFAIDELYYEIYNLIYNKNYNKLLDVDKLFILNYVVIHGDYRKKQILDEFIESVYREHQNINTLIIANVKPFQYNPYLMNYLKNQKKFKSNNEPNRLLTAYEYYDLNQFESLNDEESNQYKLFNVFNKQGFSRLNSSNIFEFDPKIVEAKLRNK